MPLRLAPQTPGGERVKKRRIKRREEMEVEKIDRDHRDDQEKRYFAADKIHRAFEGLFTL